MFSPEIVQSDAFFEMPVSSRELYFQFGMSADDDGFVNPKRIMKTTGSSDDDLKILLTKRFVLPFENGVIVIKHWRIHNRVRPDMYKPTLYIEQRNKLFEKENGGYTFDFNQGSPVRDVARDVVRGVGKVRLGKVSKEKDYRISENSVSLEKQEKPLKVKKNSMIKGYDENNPPDDLPSVEIGSEETVVEPPVKQNLSKAYAHLLKWSETRRGSKFPAFSIGKQYKAFSRAVSSKIHSADLKVRWIEFENDEFRKRNGFDWADVVASFAKRPAKSKRDTFENF